MPINQFPTGYKRNIHLAALKRSNKMLWYRGRSNLLTGIPLTSARLAKLTLNNSECRLASIRRRRAQRKGRHFQDLSPLYSPSGPARLPRTLTCLLDSFVICIRRAQFVNNSGISRIKKQFPISRQFFMRRGFSTRIFADNNWR